MNFLDNKIILVTGGTGSFGRVFIDTILQNSNAKKVIVFSRDEYKQAHMQHEIKDSRIRFFIGDVRDEARLMHALEGVDIVVHAAALKHVPLLEYNPSEAIKTNILGTQNVVHAAYKNGVEKMLLISTDKAVSPTNLYGATKLCAEKLCISANTYGLGKTAFSVARYGNVAGSRGSIIEFMKKQGSAGIVPLTDERMTRFWMTVDQGVQFVLQSLNMMKGGETFIPKIPSMKVKNLMEILAPGAEIKIIGMRPGEKLHESLITEHEARRTREFDNHFVIEPALESWNNWWDGSHLSHGKQVPEDFHYASHLNTHWLSPEELRQIVGEV